MAYTNTAFTTMASESLVGTGQLVDKLNTINAAMSTQMSNLVSSLNAGTALSSQDLLNVQTQLQNLTVAMEMESSMVKAVSDLLKSIVSKVG